MSLSSIAMGSGPDMVLIHGWGMNSDVFEPITFLLSQYFRLTCIDLPGHGRSVGESWPEKLPVLVDQLLAIAPAPAVWLGWSLGGLLAIEAALKEPNSINRLILLASSPRFTRTDNWPCAISENELFQFMVGFDQTPLKTLLRFSAFQFQGVAEPVRGLRFLRNLLDRSIQPELPALKRGLKVLLETDLRRELADCTQPSGIILGERDALIPSCIGTELVSTIPGIRNIQIRGAGHAPFITHPKEVVSAIIAMMGEGEK